MALQNIGNEIVKLFGGRSVHPVGSAVGGFYRAPTIAETQELLEKIKNELSNAQALVYFCAGITIPNEDKYFTCVALHNGTEYPFNHGNITSNEGLSIKPSEFLNHFKEEQVHYSTALHARLNGKPYLVGPLARLNLNHQCLPQTLKDLIKDIGITLPSYNMFHSMLARAIEIYYCLLEALRILKSYQYNAEPRDEHVVAKAGQGFACTEAPRGILWHEYQTAGDGTILKSNIIPPTSQNQLRIETNLYESLEGCPIKMAMDDNELRLHCEKIIRNYDPCISCSTHFINLKVIRE